MIQLALSLEYQSPSMQATCVCASYHIIEITVTSRCINKLQTTQSIRSTYTSTQYSVPTATGHLTTVSNSSSDDIASRWVTFMHQLIKQQGNYNLLIITGS